MLVRPFRPSEMTALAEMRRAMTRELDGEDLDQEHAGWRQRFAGFVDELLAADEATFFVAELEGALIGMGGIYKLRNHRSVIYGVASAYVTSVYVAPEHRRLGIATRITQAAVAWAREHGCAVVRLRASKTGRRVYEALGFTPTDEMELRLESVRPT